MNRFFLLICTLAATALAGCVQDRYYPASDTTASPGQSGVTVYGEIDTSVVRTR